MLAEAGWPLTPEIADALYIGMVTDTGPLRLRQHPSRHAPRRRRAHRGRGRSRPHVADPLRGAAARPPAADGPRPRARAVAGRRPDAGGGAHGRRLRRRRRRRHRGHRRGDARRARRARRRPGARGRPRGELPRLPAHGRPRDRRLRDRPAGGRRGPSRGRRFQHRAALPTTCWRGSGSRWASAWMRTEPMAEAAVAPAPALWLVDKPAGPTSHDIVATARRALGRTAKVGHCGTLDPFATGLLVLHGGPRHPPRPLPDRPGQDLPGHAAHRLRLGDARSGGADRRARAIPPPSRGCARCCRGSSACSASACPALSAVRVEGERLYRKARRGEDVGAARARGRRSTRCGPSRTSATAT